MNDTGIPPRLRALGLTESLRDAAGDHGDDVARVTAQHRGRYRLATRDSDVDAVVAGRLRTAAGPAGLPATGDWVLAPPAPGDGARMITAVLPRQSLLVRKRPGREAAQVMAANVDTVLVAVSLAEGVNSRRVERYVALAWDAGARPVLVLTKLDLCADPAAAVAVLAGAAPGVDVAAVSAETGAGLDGLLQYLPPGRTAVVVGPSGAGKSTLTNALLGEDRLRTLAVRRDGKGRHTTTHRELFLLPAGGVLIDTPGLREIGLWQTDEGVAGTFEEVEELAAQCRFRDCSHRIEPGCAVLRAVASGHLDPARAAAWHRLRREIGHQERSRSTARAAEAGRQERVAQRAFHDALKRKGLR